MWIQIHILQPGASSLLSPHLFANFCWALNWLQETLQRLTALFHSITHNGHLQLYDWKTMYLPSICHCASGQAHQPGCMFQCRMPPQTFCSSKASGLYPARWMITSSSRFSASFCQDTTGDTRHAIGTSCQKVNSMTAEGSRMV